MTLSTSFSTNVLPGSVTGPVQQVTAAVLDSTSDALTATPSGTQGTSLLLVSILNRVTVVTTAADGVRLPPALAGMKVTISNAASNALGVFPSSAAQGGVTGGDKINALAQNAVFSQVTGKLTFNCFTKGTWQTA